MLKLAPSLSTSSMVPIAKRTEKVTVAVGQYQIWAPESNRRNVHSNLSATGSFRQKSGGKSGSGDMSTAVSYKRSLQTDR